jgi:hypothetical protein
MLVTCIAYTKGLQPWHITQAIENFASQSYAKSQLIIINNYDTLKQCQEIEIIHHRDLCIIDRPGYSNGRALLEALKMASGQTIAHYPLDHCHHLYRIQLGVELLERNGAAIIAPTRKWKWDGVPVIVEAETNVVPELAIYKSPAYTDDYDIDYGAWWSYPLLAHEMGLDIIGTDDLLACQLPKEKPTNKNYLEFLHNQ